MGGVAARVRKPERHTLEHASCADCFPALFSCFAAYIEEFACDGDTLRVCGTFANNDEARRFFLLFQSNYLVVNAVAAAGVYDRDFCAENPGASVSLNNFEWLGKYANVWGPDCLRYRPVGQCAATAVNYQYTCPIPAPPCATCLRWTVTGCKLNYYGGDVCQDALKNLKFYMDKIGYGGEFVSCSLCKVLLFCLVLPAAQVKGWCALQGLG